MNKNIMDINTYRAFSVGPQTFILECICKNFGPGARKPVQLVAKSPCGTKVIDLPGEVHPEIMNAFRELGLKQECYACLEQNTR